MRLNPFCGFVLILVVPVVAMMISTSSDAPAGTQQKARLPSNAELPGKNGAPTDAASIATGRRLYEMHCWFCHGTEGRGDGPVAESLPVKPRDFTRAQYKIRSTPHGALPTDADLFQTITRGVPGTHMPEWFTLSESDRWQLVAYIKTFSEQFRTVGVPTVIDASDPLDHSDEVIQRGRELFHDAKCWLCHGKQGRGDGPITTALVRQWGKPYQARNLTDGASYKGGSTVEDIFRTITTGFNGTPMGSHRDVLAEGERWEVAHFVNSLAGQDISRHSPAESGVSWQRGRWTFFGKGHCIVLPSSRGARKWNSWARFE